jgi:hypothetical protein
MGRVRRFVPAFVSKADRATGIDEIRRRDATRTERIGDARWDRT